MFQTANIESSREEVLKLLTPPVGKWFSHFTELTLPQRYGVKLIHERENVLISAPTGSGKTLTAFLSILNELVKKAEEGTLENRVYCIYVSPLRALAADIERNLIQPLSEIEKIIAEREVSAKEGRAGKRKADGENNGTVQIDYGKDETEIESKKLGIRVAMRSGDTTPSERAKMVKKPPHILITTPESLSIILCSPKFVESFHGVEWVVIDEIHELANSKRGVHLSLSMERLQRMCAKPFSRIGLSATISPLDKIAHFLVGNENGSNRQCTIVDAQYAKEMNLRLISPVEDLIHTPSDKIQKRTYEIIDELVQAHRTTLIFTNTRSGTERLIFHLKTMFPKKYLDSIEAHHSSLSREERKNVETKLKNGELKVVVSSTSLELGIDIGYIDLVIQLGSPKSVARALQRTGRSGHDVYKISEGRLIAQDRDDLVEIAVMLSEAKRGKIDRVQIPENCLDVLAQHVIGMAVEKNWTFEEAFSLVTKSYCYRNLSREDFDSVLRFLSGAYGGLEKYRVYGKIWYEEEKKEFGKRGKLLRVLYATNTGTIPDEVSVTVNLLPITRHIGSVEEEFLEKMKKGDVFILGGKSYRFEYAKGMQCYVSLATGLKPTIPRWFSEMLPLSFDLAFAISKFRGKLAETMVNKGKEGAISFLQDECWCDENAAKAIYNYFAEQMGFLKLLNCTSFHSEKNLIVEEFLSEGKRHFIFHSLFGRRVNEVLSKLLAAKVSHAINRNVVISFNDNGFVLTCTRAVDVEMKKYLFMLFHSNVEEEAKEAIKQTETLKRKFRHVATRSLMILRNYMGKRRSVGRQQLSAHILLGISSRLEGFPVMKETYREILEDHMDLKSAKHILEALKNGEINAFFLRPYDLPSPFAQLLITLGISDVVMMQDRKAVLEQLHTLVMKRMGKSPDGSVVPA